MDTNKKCNRSDCSSPESRLMRYKISKNGQEIFICQQCQRNRIRKYMESQHGKKIIYEAVERSRKKHLLKQKARMKVHHAIEKGKIERKNCFCGKIGHAHHEDYSKPLDVVWLCTTHHAYRHKEMKGLTSV